MADGAGGDEATPKADYEHPADVTDTPHDEEDQDAEKLPDNNKSILLGMISQLKNGVDLSRVTLPTFILEPRSFIERLTDFMTHGQLVVSVHAIEDPVERMLQVIRWHLSGWHVRPKGVRKPYNPVLNESFRAHWEHAEDGSQTHFIGEQISHHPPISGFYFVNRKANFVVDGCILPRSKFLMNSAASLLEGQANLHILNHGELYECTFPSYYARGILVGTLKMELAGSCKVTCSKTGLVCEMEFKNKGFFRGEHNAVTAKLKRGKEVLYTIEGRWDRQVKYWKGTKKKDEQVFFDVKSDITPKVVPPEDEQTPWESRRVWGAVTRALRAGDLDEATKEKTKLEDAQRADEKARGAAKAPFKPVFFHETGKGMWSFKKPVMTPYAAESPEDTAFEQEWAQTLSAGICNLPAGETMGAAAAGDAAAK